MTQDTPDRMTILPDNPGTIRDTATEKNYHLPSPEEAAELALIINGLDAYALFLVESYDKQIVDMVDEAAGQGVILTIAGGV